MKYFRPILVVLVCFLSSYLAFDTLWKHPHEVLVSSNGDGIKNYYTPIWYVLHDSSGHFSGMQYPYGDNYVFADAQPLLSSTLRWYHHHVSPLTPYHIIGAINLAMVLGLVLCNGVLYVLLRKLGLPWLYALGTGVLITLLTPQIGRFHGHYGLSYAFAVPLTWLLCHNILQRRWFVAWALGLGLLMGTLLLLHVYFLLVCGMFAGLYALIAFATNLQYWRKFGLRPLAIVVAIAVPFLGFQIWISNASAVADRTEVPYGMQVYKANFQSVFMPPYRPMLTGNRADFEGQAYIGFLGLVVLLLLLYKSLGYARRLRWGLIVKPVLPAPLREALWPAFIALFFAMGIPLLWMIDWLPDGLKQFRSLGRFAWVIYYVFAVLSSFTLYQFYRYLSIRGAGKAANFLMAMAILFWAYEVQLHLRSSQHTIYHHYKDKTTDHFLQPLFAEGQELFSGKDYQAIIPLPFFHSGSEKIQAHPNNITIYKAMQASLQLSLPILANHLSRTSVSQTIKQWQLFSAPTIYRTLLADLNDDRPFLLITHGAALLPIEIDLIARADTLGQVGGVGYYSLPASQLQTSKWDYYENYLAAKDSLMAKGNLWANKDGYYYKEDFDAQPNAIGFFNSGARTTVNDTIWLARDLMLQTGEDTLEVSFWNKIETKHWGMGEVWATMQAEGLEQFVYINPSTSRDVYQSWLRIAFLVPPHPQPIKLRLFVTGKYLAIDEMLIKPLYADVYEPTLYPDTVRYNNYFVYPINK